MNIRIDKKYLGGNMKKFICILIVNIFCIIFVACGSNTDHTGEAKTPSASSELKGEDYNNVMDTFKEEGFTNIKLEKIEDLITGWLTKDGEVEEVSVGGDFEYSSDKWVNSDTEIVIRYHTFPEDKNEVVEEKSEESTKQEEISENNNENNGKENEADEVLTIDNCEELAKILLTNADIYEEYANFASKYEGRTIEFDGKIDYISNHENYKTRYDILVGAGDYDPNHAIGPAFQFKDVAAYDLGLDTINLEDKIKVGKNVRIVAKVGAFNSKNLLFYLDPISITDR